MQIIPLGVGSALALTLDNSNFLVRPARGESFVVDFGHTAPHALAKHGFDIGEAGRVFVSHLHSDHIGGLECLGFTTRFVRGSPRPVLYAPAPIFDFLWPRALEAGMGHGGVLEDFFDPRPLAPGAAVRVGSVSVRPLPVRHVEGRPNFGYLLHDEVSGGRAFLTCDSRFAPELLEDHCRDADLIFHDVELGGTPSGVHARLDELAGLPEAWQQKIILVHYSDDWSAHADRLGRMRLGRAGHSYDV
jgi:ribonuclease BN (tRNA processing enzyme)